MSDWIPVAYRLPRRAGVYYCDTISGQEYRSFQKSKDGRYTGIRSFTNTIGDNNVIRWKPNEYERTKELRVGCGGRVLAETSVTQAVLCGWPKEFPPTGSIKDLYQGMKDGKPESLKILQEITNYINAYSQNDISIHAISLLAGDIILHDETSPFGQLIHYYHPPQITLRFNPL